MSDWIPLEKDFIEADVVRWEEAVYAKFGRRSRRPAKIGTRRVTGEVLKGPDGEGWVALLVRQCEVLTETVIGQVVEKFRNGRSVRRSRDTILRGKPERLLWTDETARDVVLASLEPVPLTPKRRRTPSTGQGSRRRARRPTRK
ncbi:MAG: hypothetical protein AMXMBFR8_06720 [Nevskiales bacterium]